MEPWLITPYRNAADNSLEARFNLEHSRARGVIERLNGVFKGRFRCLLKARELHYNPAKAAKIINVCTMLHNVCIKYKVHFDENLIIQRDNLDADLSFNAPDSNYTNREANIIRDEIKMQL